MTARTWKQANALMATADEGLSAGSMERAALAAVRRWGVDPRGGILLATREQVYEGDGLDLVRHGYATEWREITDTNLEHGWALCWVQERRHEA
jgi:hypothetical protein